MKASQPTLWKLTAVLLTGVGLLAAGCGGASRFTGQALNVAPRLAARAVESGPYTLLTMPEDGVSPLVGAMRNAKKSIKIKVYMFTNHDASQQLVAALVERARAGVDVQVVVDVRPYVPPSPPECKPVNTSPNMEAIKALQAGGVRVRYASPRFRFTHEKSMLIDGQAAYIMTTNFTNSAFTSNREFILINRKPADVKELNRIFECDWNEDVYTPGDTPLVVSPVNSRSRIFQLIDSAQKTLTLQVEYITDPEMVKHIGARVAAGVDVTVMMTHLEPNPCIEGDTIGVETQLMNEAGVKKFAFLKSIKMHAKSIVADGQRAFIGSENLTTNSLDKNREVGILIDDPKLVARLREVAASDWANGRPTEVVTDVQEQQ